ncbi:MAG: HAD family hydrolase [Acidimicrobiales bacterium]
MSSSCNERSARRDSDENEHHHGLHLPIRAAIFDFNGTLSDDEQLLTEIYEAIFCEQLGIYISNDEYYHSLAGLSDPEIVTTVLQWHGRADSALVDRLLEEKIRRYLAEVRDRPRIVPGAVELVVEVARRVPVAIVTGAARVEVEASLEAAGLSDAVGFVVAAEDVSRGKPDPEGYDIACQKLASIAASQIVVFEDSIAGLRAAKAAGMQCVAVVGTTDSARLATETETVVDQLTPQALMWFLALLPAAAPSGISRGPVS